MNCGKRVMLFDSRNIDIFYAPRMGFTGSVRQGNRMVSDRRGSALNFTVALTSTKANTALVSMLFTMSAVAIQMER